MLVTLTGSLLHQVLKKKRRSKEKKKGVSQSSLYNYMTKPSTQSVRVGMFKCECLCTCPVTISDHSVANQLTPQGGRTDCTHTHTHPQRQPRTRRSWLQDGVNTTPHVAKQPPLNAFSSPAVMSSEREGRRVNWKINKQTELTVEPKHTHPLVTKQKQNVMLERCNWDFFEKVIHLFLIWWQQHVSKELNSGNKRLKTFWNNKRNIWQRRRLTGDS